MVAGLMVAGLTVAGLAGAVAVLLSVAIVT
jgi:hypothetical protein